MGGWRSRSIRPDRNTNASLARSSPNRNISVIGATRTSRAIGVTDAPRAESGGLGPGGAERVGFEPTDHLTAVNALAGRPIRPLWHLSGTVRV
jgi:hypothetical protein